MNASVLALAALLWDQLEFDDVVGVLGSGAVRGGGGEIGECYQHIAGTGQVSEASAGGSPR